MDSHDDVAKIYDFAKSNGYKVTAFQIADRHNSKGAYSVAEVTLLIPRSEDKKPSAEAQKEEVINYDI